MQCNVLTHQDTILRNIENHQKAVESVLKYNIDDIERLCDVTLHKLKNEGRIFFAGNGGSAADSQHLAAEFVGRFRKERLSLPAMALTTDTSILTAVANDYGYDMVFSRQVSSLCSDKDIFIAISTSGNSKNLTNAVIEAKRKNVFTVGLLGKDGGELRSLVDLPIVVNVNETARVQECHILIGHILCDMCDEQY